MNLEIQVLPVLFKDLFMQVILVWNADPVFCRICPESSQSNQHNISRVLLFCLTSNQTSPTHTVFAKPVCIKENPIRHLMRLYGRIQLNLSPLKVPC